MASRIYGPLLSTSSIESHSSLLGDLFGMRDVGTAQLDDESTHDLFGTEGTTRIRALQTPDVEAGALVCRFESSQAEAEETVREEHSRIFTDAFRVIDFYTPDFDAALAHAATMGFDMQAGEAKYETNEGGFREAHHHGADNVVTAFLHGPADFFVDFAEVRDRVTSEPVSVSLPLTDAAPTLAWYQRVLGWGVVYEYDFVAASFSQLMGVDVELKVRSSTVGPSRQQTYVNIVDYGLSQGHGGSLAGRSMPPRRGLLGLVVLTDDLDEVVGAAKDDAGAVVALDLDPFGLTRAVVLNAPFGSPHLVVERTSRWAQALAGRDR